MFQGRVLTCFFFISIKHQMVYHCYRKEVRIIKVLMLQIFSIRKNISGNNIGGKPRVI